MHVFKDKQTVVKRLKQKARTTVISNYKMSSKLVSEVIYLLYYIHVLECEKNTIHYMIFF